MLLSTFSWRNYELKRKSLPHSFKLVRFSNFRTLSYIAGSMTNQNFTHHQWNAKRSKCFANVWQLKENLKFKIKITLNKTDIYQKGLRSQLTICISWNANGFSSKEVNFRYSWEEIFQENGSWAEFLRTTSRLWDDSTWEPGRTCHSEHCCLCTHECMSSVTPHRAQKKESVPCSESASLTHYLRIRTSSSTHNDLRSVFPTAWL